MKNTMILHSFESQFTSSASHSYAKKNIPQPNLPGWNGDRLSPVDDPVISLVPRTIWIFRNPKGLLN